MHPNGALASGQSIAILEYPGSTPKLALLFGNLDPRDKHIIP